MGNKLSEDEVSWSCIEKHNDYDKVVWSCHKNGIPTYALLDEEGKKVKTIFGE